MTWTNTVGPVALPQDQYDALIMKWQKSKETLEIAKEEEIALRKQVAEQNLLRVEEKKEGVNTNELGNGYAMKTTVKYNYKLTDDNDKIDAMLDTLEKTGNEGAFLAERLVSWKATLSVSEYKDLDPKYKKIVDTVLTITEGTPTVELKEPKAKK